MCNGPCRSILFCQVPNLLPYADGGEMEGWLNGRYQRFGNGSLNPALVIPTLQLFINVSRLRPPKEVPPPSLPPLGSPRSPRPLCLPFLPHPLPPPSPPSPIPCSVYIPLSLFPSPSISPPSPLSMSG